MITDTDYILDRLEEEVKTLPDVKNECLQHLVELGYISLTLLNALRPADVQKAKDHFLNEARDSILYHPADFLGAAFREPDNFLVDLLRKAVDIDEGYVFEKLPEAGTLNLATRIIHYRLDVLGLWPFAINMPWSLINSEARLKMVAGFLKSTPLEAINFLADIENLTKHLLSAYENDTFIFAFHANGNLPKDIIRKLDQKGAFSRQLVDDFGERSDFIKFVKKEILKGKRTDFGFLRQEAENPFKKFLLRLIQVHQWQEGFYNGLLDGDLGEVSMQSLMDAVEFYNTANRKNVKIHRVLTYVNDGYFLFNALFFLREYMVEEARENAESSAEDTVISNIINQVQHSNNTTVASFHDGFLKLKSEILADSASKPQERKGLLQRIYFGIKKIIKKVFKIAKNIFNWIVETTKKFWGLLKKVFRHFFENLRNGIKAFADGMKFLLGKREVTTTGQEGLIASKMQFDGDSFNLVLGQSNSLVETHLGKMQYHAATLQFSVAVVGGVINIVKNILNVLSWPLLVFTIIKIYKHIKEAYTKLQLATP
ncbi:MAG: hypothetical protein R2750_09305 [Bacteroidales bacterium]